MTDENYFPHYGELNKLQDKQGKNRLEIGRTSGLSIDVLKDAVRKTNTASEIHPGPYIGVVLRVYDSGDSSDILTRVSNWFYERNTWSVKVRIPEIHGHLPSPSSIGSKDDVAPEDDRIIEAHTTFRPVTFKDVDKPEAGDYVRVEFKNGEGFLIEGLKDNGGENKKVVIPKNQEGAKAAHGKSRPEGGS